MWHCWTQPKNRAEISRTDNKGNVKQVPTKAASKKTHPKSNKVAVDKEAEGTGVVESQVSAVQGSGVQYENQDPTTEDPIIHDASLSQSQQHQDEAISDPNMHEQSQQHGEFQYDSQLQSSDVQAVSDSTQPATRRMTRQQAALERMMASP